MKMNIRVTLVATLVWGMLSIAEPLSAQEPPNAIPDTIEKMRAAAINEMIEWQGKSIAELVRETGAEVDRCGSQMPIIYRNRRSVLIALAWAGNEEALAESIRIAGLTVDQARAAGKNRDESFQIWDSDGVPPHTRLLLTALDMHKPDAANKLRKIILESQAPPESTIVMGPKALSEMTPQEIEHIAQNTDEQPDIRQAAMRLWLAHAQKQAQDKLLKVMNDERLTTNQSLLSGLEKSRIQTLDINMRCDAAAALVAWSHASEGPQNPIQRKALEWLLHACTSGIGLGGRPATAILDAGCYAEEYFKFMQDHDGKNLPYPFRYAIRECREDIFFRHIERFLAISNESARHDVHVRIANTALSKDNLAVLAHIATKERSDAQAIAGAIAQSLARNPSPGREARTIASTWIDLTLSKGDSALWNDLSRCFLECGLGSRDSFRRAARSLLDNPSTAARACDVLAEAGDHEDAAAIWRRIHRDTCRNGRISPSIQEVELLSQGWLAVVRLCSPSVK